jgi:hypothetical protein
VLSLLHVQLGAGAVKRLALHTSYLLYCCCRRWLLLRLLLAAAAARRGFQPKPFRESCNQFEYGSEEPPIYNLSKVTAPVVIFAGRLLSQHMSHMS